MALFGGKKSVSTTKNTTNVNDRTVTQGAVQDGGMSISALDGSDVTIYQSDLGAIDGAFMFAEEFGSDIVGLQKSTLAEFADLQADATRTLSNAIGDVASAKQSELKGTVDELLKWGTLAFAIYFGAKAFTK